MMNPRESEQDRPRVALLEYPPDEVPRLQNKIPDVDWMQSEQVKALSDQTTPDAIVVKAYKDGEDRALEICEEIRQDRRFDDVPVLVAISIYQMPLGNNVRKLPNAHFVFTPFKREEVLERLEELNGG